MDIFWTILAIFWTLGMFLAGFAGCLVVNWWIEKRAKDLNLQKASLRGVEAKQEQSERLMAFMVEVKAAYEKSQAEKKSTKDFMMQDMPAIALKYPDILLKFGTRLEKLLKKEGGLNLEGLTAA